MKLRDQNGRYFARRAIEVQKYSPFSQIHLIVYSDPNVADAMRRNLPINELENRVRAVLSSIAADPSIVEEYKERAMLRVLRKIF